LLTHSTNFIYDVEGARSENCILISTDDWYANTSNEIIEFDQWGGIARTFITKTLGVNIPNNSKYAGILKAGDVVMITHIAANVFCKRYFLIPIDLDSTHYTDIPMAHVIGKFNKKVSFSTFQPITNYVLTKTVKGVDESNGVLVTTEETVSVQEVVKVGPWVKDLKPGDKVLVRDNVMTPIMLNSVEYNAINYDMIVGVFKENVGVFSLDNLDRLLGTYVLMEAAQAEFANEGSMIYNPNYDIDSDKDCMSEVWTDRYRVLRSNLKCLKEDEIVFVPREALNYVTLRGIQYFVAFDTDFMLAKITKE
jgi:hypothetical protein